MSGRLHLQVEKTGESTLAAQIGEVLANTLDHHLALEDQGKRIVDGWAVPSVILTGTAAIVRGFQGAMSVFCSHPGVDMMFIGPMTLLNFLNLASRNQILVKDGRSLELMREVDTILFDKTGTLTLEQPQVKTVHLCHALDASLTEETILTYAAAAEQRQSHPIAKA
ncbi:MAG: heavy metal translocating P-type ATPase, partial [Chloroflexota bacterium]